MMRELTKSDLLAEIEEEIEIGLNALTHLAVTNLEENSVVWTGFGDSCIADIESGRGGDDKVTFTLTEEATVVITAATSLTCDGWPGTSNNGEDAYGDPYIYLYDEDDNLLESDDDDGCTDQSASGNCWDSYIVKTLSTGTYYVVGKVYSSGTSGWYTLNIDLAAV